MALREVLFIIGISACVASFHSPSRAADRLCSCSSNTITRVFTINCDTLGWKENTFGDCVKLFHKTNFTEKNIERLSVVNLPDDIRIPSRVFEGTSVRILDISFSNNISMWADKEEGPAFVGLENSLEELDFLMSMKVPRKFYDYRDDKAPISLGHLRKLKRVSFMSNDIKVFTDGWFEKGPSSLEYLKLKSSKTRYFGERAFASLTNLKEIDLSGNDFESLSRSMFPNPANHLEKMNLEENKVEYFSDDFFTNMPALKYVKLERNFISHLKEEIWRPVWSQLTYLNLAYNRLKCYQEMRWIFEVTPPRELYARCEAPKELADMTLNELIEIERNRGYNY